MTHKVVLCPTPMKTFGKENKPKQFLYLGDFIGIFLRPETIFRALLALQGGKKKNDLPKKTWACAIDFSGFEYTLGLIQQEVEMEFPDSSLSALNSQ